MKTIEGDLTIKNKKIAIIAGRFNSFIVEHLISGAKEALLKHGADDSDIDLLYVPGAFEIPLALKKTANTGRYDGIVALGAVIRGGTPHFEFVAGECVKGISKVALDSEIPIAFGVLTVDTVEQAIERSSANSENKGAEAAESTIRMINLLEKL
ncbi:MAG: 6,7-dimethyl-8-ribityllumazine synthase [Candidatus Thioglobus sp.]|jgi:6,7-dimethyl-8-ribityllumazine synthase|nr:6,7-dimethyl-8-ribityllumazine synthase [Candidatus Thioglobus sp.]|tara:strand:- start:12 stop:473 length:462 start_codon:yes stop_codon:yes gene_type:complete